MIRKEELKKTISNYLKKYKGGKTVKQIIDEISYTAESEKEKSFILLEVVNQIVFDSNLDFSSNYEVIVDKEYCDCTECPDGIESSFNAGDMFDLMTLSVYCKRLKRYICKDTPLDNYYEIDNREFCPRLTNKK